MAKLLQRETLPADVRKEFVRILSTDSEAITDTDRAFLYARRDYLSAEEIKTFDVKAVKPEGEKKVAKKKTATKSKKG